MPINGIQASAGMKPTTPTIGTASDGGTGTTVNVAFTPSSYIGKGTIQYTVISNPGSITATGSGSPLNVTGLTAGTAYTFTVRGNTNYGVASDLSAASNSVTPVVPTAYDSIASATGTGSSTTITFSSIPSTYSHLQLRIMCAPATTGGQILIRANNDSGTNYSRTTLSINGSSQFQNVNQNTQSSLWMAVQNGMSANIANVAIVDIHDYKSTAKNKTFRHVFGNNPNGGGNTFEIGGGAWYSTSAINRIDIISSSANFTANSVFALYGIKG